MLDTIGYYESRAGTTVLQAIAGLTDPHVDVSGDNIRVPDECDKILAALGIAQTATAGGVTDMQLKAPSMGEKSYLDLTNFRDSATAAPIVPSPPTIDSYRYNPRKLVSGEILNALTANSGTNTEDALVIVFLTDGNINPIPLDWVVETIRGVAASAVTANVWSNKAITLDQNLQAGKYAVVGMAIKSANSQAARLVFGNQGPRPGCPGRTTFDYDVSMFRKGELGIWGTFPHTNIPTVDLLCDGADTPDIWLDVVKIA